MILDRLLKKIMRALVHVLSDGRIEDHMLRACREGNNELLRATLAFGANLFYTDSKDNNCLHHAVREGHTSLVHFLSSHEPRLLFTLTHDDESVLHIAVEQNNLNMVELLLRKAKQDATTLLSNRERLCGWNALHMAVWNNNTRITRRLLSAGTLDVDARTADNETALHFAAEQGLQGIVSILLKQNASVDVLDERGDSPLVLAALENRVEALSLMLPHLTQRSLTSSVFNADGLSLLHIAASHSDTEALSLLLSVPALCERALNHRDGTLRTPLLVAAGLGHVESVRALLRKGADQMISDMNGDIPLIATVRINDKTTVSVLLDNLIANKTQLHLALEFKNDCGLNALTVALNSASITHSVTPLLLPHYSRSACDTLASALSSSLSLFPEDAEAAQSTTQCAHKTRDLDRVLELLQWAKENTDCAERVVNTRDKNGETLLYRAARAGHEHAVNMLLSHNADASLSDALGVWPEAIAALRGHAALALSLRAARVDTQRERSPSSAPVSLSLKISHSVESVCVLNNTSQEVNASTHTNTPFTVCVCPQNATHTHAVRERDASRATVSLTGALSLCALLLCVLCARVLLRFVKKKKDRVAH